MGSEEGPMAEGGSSLWGDWRGRERKKGVVMGGAHFKRCAEVGDGSVEWRDPSGVVEGTWRCGRPSRGRRPIGAGGGGTSAPLGRVPAQIGQSGGWWVGPATVPGSIGHWHVGPSYSARVWISQTGQFHPNLKFKLIQTLTNPKLTLPSSKFFEKMVLKISERWTTFSIETYSDLKGVWNENSGKSLGLEFDRIKYNFFLELWF
jgi:hypothetical protein